MGRVVSFPFVEETDTSPGLQRRCGGAGATDEVEESAKKQSKSEEVFQSFL